MGRTTTFPHSNPSGFRHACGVQITALPLSSFAAQGELVYWLKAGTVPVGHSQCLLPSPQFSPCYLLSVYRQALVSAPFSKPKTFFFVLLGQGHQLGKAFLNSSRWEDLPPFSRHSALRMAWSVDRASKVSQLHVSLATSFSEATSSTISPAGFQKPLAQVLYWAVSCTL